MKKIRILGTIIMLGLLCACTKFVIKEPIEMTEAPIETQQTTQEPDERIPEIVPTPAESSQSEKSNVDILAYDASKHPNFIVHEQAVWNITPEQANQQYISSYLRTPAIDANNEEAVTKRFLQTPKKIKAESFATINAYQNEKGDKLVIETNKDGQVRYDFTRFSPIEEENRKKITGIANKEMTAKITKELEGYFPQAYLRAPRSEAGIWDYDRKTVFGIAEYENRQISSPFFMIFFDHVDEQSIPYFDGEEGIAVTYYEDGLSRIAWSWNNFSPANPDKIHLIPFDEVLTLAYQALQAEGHPDNPEILYVSKIELCYTNWTNFDTEPNRFDLHWSLQTSHRNYWVNCVTKQVYYS